MAVRVFVAGRDPLARAGLSALLAREPGLTLVGGGRAEDLENAAIDAVLVDGAGAADLPESVGTVPVVALVAEETEVAEALAAGARGVLLRTAEPARIAAALQAAAAGLVALEPALAAAALRPRAVVEPLGESLTPREHEVLQLLTLGLSNRAIGVRLGISEHTAKFHVNAILGKLGASSRAEAIVRAARAGLVAL